MAFSIFGLHPDVVRGVQALGFTQPTAIQQAAIAPAVEGRDVLACAATGSGKTAAFLLPILHRLLTSPGHKATPAHATTLPAVEHGGSGTHSAPGHRRRGPRALILTPTRELASQILEHLEALAGYTHIRGASIIGGVGMGPQARAFDAGGDRAGGREGGRSGGAGGGVDVLIATPGRLLDHLRRPYGRLDALEILVLDEADRMLDMGFLPDVRRIVALLPANRQTLFFSATMPAEVRQLMNSMLKNPVTIETQRQAAPAAAITQAIYPVPQHLKTNLLCHLLEGPALDSVICFTRTKHRANRLAAALKVRGISCVPIHGNRSQGQRTAALDGFKNGAFRVLVATDIAARGIDVALVSHVINFDCPHLAEDYIHRVGRTGRASADGDAFTFVADDEQANLRTIERALGKKLPRITLPDFNYAEKAAERLEVPVAERIAAIRAEKDRARARQGGSSGHSGQGAHAAGAGHSGGHKNHSATGHGGSHSGNHAGGNQGHTTGHDAKAPRPSHSNHTAPHAPAHPPGGGRAPAFRHRQLPGKYPPASGGRRSGAPSGQRRPKSF